MEMPPAEMPPAARGLRPLDPHSLGALEMYASDVFPRSGKYSLPRPAGEG